MNGLVSLITHDEDALYEGCAIARKKPDEIKRIKLTTRALNDGRFTIDDVSKAKDLLKGTNTEVYVGGGITDKAVEEGTLAQHIAELQKYEVNTIEVGNPSSELIKTLQGEFKTVLGEVGSKSRTDKYSRDYKEWEKSLRTCIDNGLRDIILEGGTGGVGIYTSEYKTRTFLLMQLMRVMQEQGYEGDTVIEASQPEQQSMMYSIFGPSIHLGNIAVDSYGNIGEANINAIAKVYNSFEPERVAGYYELLDYLFAVAKKRNISPSKFMFDDRLTSIHGIQVLNSIDTIKDILDTLIPRDESSFGSIKITMVDGGELEGGLGSIIGALLRHIEGEE